MAVIDWEYYSSHFPVVIPESNFAAVEAQAEEEYKRDISEDRQKSTIFRLCNFLYSNQEVIAGSGVTSVNNNGYSETYAISNMQQATEQIREIIYDGIGTRLAGAF